MGSISTTLRRPKYEAAVTQLSNLLRGSRPPAGRVTGHSYRPKFDNKPITGQAHTLEYQDHILLACAQTGQDSRFQCYNYLVRGPTPGRRLQWPACWRDVLRLKLPAPSPFTER